MITGKGQTHAVAIVHIVVEVTIVVHVTLVRIIVVEIIRPSKPKAMNCANIYDIILS